MKAHLCVYARYNKVIELLDYSEESLGNFNLHTLLAVPAQEQDKVYVITGEEDIKILLNDAFRCKQMTESEWINIMQNEKNPPKLLGLQSLMLI